MLRAVLAGASAFAFAFSSAVYPQAATVQQVQLLAPQLVAFAGSSANLAALVNGLAQGIPVTLVTPTSDGQVQIATFTPPALGSAVEIARALEAARQSLISRGIATPTAQQIGAALMGGPSAVLVRSEGGGLPASGATGFSRQGNSVTLGSGTTAQTFNVPGSPVTDVELQQALLDAHQLLGQLGVVDPTPQQLQAALVGGPLAVPNGSVTLLGLLQGRVRNTSDSRFFGTSNSRVFGTSNTPPTAAGAIPAPRPDTGIPRGNTAEGANRAVRRGG
jgi:hypothetical protein